MLSRSVLIVVGLLMLSWQWTMAMAMPPLPKNPPSEVSISRPDIPGSPDIFVQSIFNIDPSQCPKGYVRTGPHHTCRRIA
ncbi:uncharacterized protein LOC6548032 [Drosophila erecta]|uniref:Uncharacterized protein n=1 Tax=Drosophila erecta TaxID=7220 RepID=B3NNT8_DROER|nr:uncharacterized protein LOC6548032 [Drosophila erecta]EDV55645.1 uncharacterized protein Dere_GG22211 [Drosophila erecta]